MAQQFPSQLLHNATEPLDSTQQVQSLAQLKDPDIVPAYVWKLVHVKETHTIYVCAKAPVGQEPTWRPVMAEDGTAFYITNVKPNGAEEVFRIFATREADGEGRIKVEYPG